MSWEESSKDILITMLKHLGFTVEIETVKTGDELCLQIHTEYSKIVIGRNGDRLEDLQYLVNRILNKHFPDAPRVKVDCDNYRQDQETKLIEKANVLAAKAIDSGKSIRTRPLNAYYRRIVHNALLEVEGVKTASPQGNARYKRIEITPAS